jgi:hypothetical protein
MGERVPSAQGWQKLRVTKIQQGHAFMPLFTNLFTHI